MTRRFRIITYTDGTDGNDIIGGWPGNDTINGLGGDDWLIGGDGSDTLRGGDGNDQLVGGDGYDTLDGGAGDDWLIGGPGGDTMIGGPGRDTVSFAGAAAAVDVDLTPGVPTGDGYDLLLGIENVVGSAHDDVIRGDAGENRLTGSAGDDTMNGGGGRDTVIYRYAAEGVTVDLAAGFTDGDGHDRLSGIESVMGSRYGDRLLGDAQDNWLTGREGDDLLDGRGGNDVASYTYADRGVSVRLEDSPGSGQGRASGEGRDTLVDIEGAVGSAHDDLLSGGDGANWLSGGAGDDTLLGLAGDDQLFGGVGHDRLEGGAGNDLLMGGLGSDLFVFGPHSGMDEIRGFEPGIDRVQLSGFPLTSFGDLQAALETSPEGVTLQLGDGSSLSFAHIGATNLNADDFVWA